MSGHGLDSVDGIARHGPRGVGELSVLPGKVDERPPDLHPSLVTKAVRVEGLQLSEQTVPVGDREAADVVDQIDQRPESFPASSMARVSTSVIPSNSSA